MSLGSVGKVPVVDPNPNGKTFAQTQNETGARNSGGSGRNSIPEATGRNPAGPGDTLVTIPPEPTNQFPDTPAMTFDPLQAIPPDQRPPPGGRPRKHPPALCCWALQDAVTLMGSVDAMIAFGTMMFFFATGAPLVGPKVLYVSLGLSSSFLFLLLAVALIIGGLNRSKVFCWIFVVGNALLYFGSVVAYFILYFKVGEDRDVVTVPFLFILVLLYKIYETLCVVYFIFEDPPPIRVLQNIYVAPGEGGNGTMVVYAAPGGYPYHYPYYGGYGRHYGYYGNPMATGLVTGMALGAMSHGMYF